MISLLSKRPSRVFSSTTIQKYQFFGTLSSLWSSSGAMLGSQRCMETELLNCAITWVTSLLRYSPSQPPGRHSEAWGGLSIPTPTPVFHCCCSATQSCLTVCDPWTAGCQASLSFTIPWSLLKLMSIESVMPSNHLILCWPILLLPSIFPSIRVFSSE